jgi:uncharacterized protein YndB with AHSA1/START domain
MKPIKKEIIVNASVEKVWNYLTDSKKLEEWLMPNNFEPEVNKKFTFQCEGHGDWDGVVACQVKELIPYQKLVYTWYTRQIEVQTLVTIEIEEMPNGTKITLVHSGWDKLMPEMRFVRDEYDNGWEDFILYKFKTILGN